MELNGDDISVLSTNGAGGDEMNADEAEDPTRKFEAYNHSIGADDASKKRVSITGTELLLCDKISRVEKSWYMISENNRIGAVGQKFFLVRSTLSFPNIVRRMQFSLLSLLLLCRKCLMSTLNL